jgi:nicotinate-nucleotide pyrophosphorylase (carboxylating)
MTYHPEIVEAVRRALDEDIGTGDITTRACIEPDRVATGRFLARESLVVGGIDVLALIY